MTNSSAPKKVAPKGKTKLPAPADYTDEVTDEHLGRIKNLVDQDQFKDAEDLSGPAW